MYYTGRARQLIVKRGVTIRQALHAGIKSKRMEEPGMSDQEKTKQRFCCCTLRTDWWQKAYQQQTVKRNQFPKLKKLKQLRKQRMEELLDIDEESRSDEMKGELVQLSHNLKPKLKEQLIGREQCIKSLLDELEIPHAGQNIGTEKSPQVIAASPHFHKFKHLCLCDPKGHCLTATLASNNLSV